MLIMEKSVVVFCVSAVFASLHFVTAQTFGDCDNASNCRNVTGGCVCCFQGYEYDSSGIPCRDIDECSTGADNCNTQATCSNTQGSFTCACNSGFSGDGVNCTQIMTTSVSTAMTTTASTTASTTTSTASTTSSSPSKLFSKWKIWSLVIASLLSVASFV